MSRHITLDQCVDATLQEGSAHLRQYISDASGRMDRELTIEGDVNFVAGTAAGTIFSPIGDGGFIVIYPTMYIQDDGDTWKGADHIDGPGMVGPHPRSPLDMLRGAHCPRENLDAGGPYSAELRLDAARQQVPNDHREQLDAHASSYGRRPPTVNIWLDEQHLLVRIDFVRRRGLTTSIELSEFGKTVEVRPPAAESVRKRRGHSILSGVREAFGRARA